jgi:hypothetical protein
MGRACSMREVRTGFWWGSLGERAVYSSRLDLKLIGRA